MKSRSVQRRFAVAAIVALMAGCSAAGEKTTTGDKSATADGKEATTEAFARLDPATFAERMKDSAAAVINVHIPYEGELENTDAFIPYDKIIGDSNLPKDKNTEILLYCRTGRMSEEAGAVLNEEGYKKVAHLEGGMKAWEAAGRKLVHNPAHVSVTPTPMPTMQHG
jgi:rhodanese-related sulfurtransferase